MNSSIIYLWKLKIINTYKLILDSYILDECWNNFIIMLMYIFQTSKWFCWFLQIDTLNGNTQHKHNYSLALQGKMLFENTWFYTLNTIISNIVHNNFIKYTISNTKSTNNVTNFYSSTFWKILIFFGLFWLLFVLAMLRIYS